MILKHLTLVNKIITFKYYKVIIKIYNNVKI